MKEFCPRRLVLARRRRKWTARLLAERSDVSLNTISRLELGGNLPEDETVEKISKALGFPKEFFFQPEPIDIDINAVSFRSFSKMSPKERDAAISAGSLGLELSEWIDKRFKLPPVNLLDLSYETSPQAAAMTMRQHWGLGESPIGDLVGLLEFKGVRLFSLSENTAQVNAFSFWRDGKPFVFLNNYRTAESSIFDSVHELAHLVLHKHGDPKENRSAEREANSFASAFLMPENDVRSRFPSFISVETVLKGKKRWRVSAMAMAHRLHFLNMLSEWQYKSMCIELGKRGYRTGEPDGVVREKSTVWRKLLVQLWQSKTTKNSIAKELCLPLDEIEGLIWKLTSPEVIATDKTMSGLKLV
jgi:Zn-dependent peptidase ImmA (M78 family)